MTLIAKSQVGVERDVLGVQGTPGSGANLQTAIVVYAPGIANPQPPVFNTWTDVQRVIQSVQGACELQIDMTGLGGGFAHVPSDADLDGLGRLKITGAGPNGEAALVMDDGAQIRNVRAYETIVFRSRANTRPPLVYNLDGLVVNGFDATFLYDGVFSQPVIDVQVASYLSMFLLGSSEFRNSHNPGAAVLRMNATQLLLAVGELYFPSSFDSTIEGPIGSSITVMTDASLPPLFANLPAFLGVLNVQNIDSNLGEAGGKIGFYQQPGAVRPTINGSRSGNAALASLLTALASQGLIIDGTIP